MLFFITNTRESKNNTKQNIVFQSRLEIMSSYSIPIISFEVIKSTNFSKQHILAFCWIKGNKCNGANLFNELRKSVFFLRWMGTHAHTLKSNAHFTDSWIRLCWDGSRMNFVMRKQWRRGRGRAQMPGWKHCQHTQRRHWLRRRHRREHGRGMAVATHADYKARSNAMKASGGKGSA